jgi:hypothetical protein
VARVALSIAARTEEQPNVPWTPAHELVLAVIKRGLDDIYGRIEGGKGPRQRRLVSRRARRWLRSQRKAEGSFLWCCSLLGLSADWIRRQVESHTSHAGSRINAAARERSAKNVGEKKISGHDRTPALPVTSCNL